MSDLNTKSPGGMAGQLAASVCKARHRYRKRLARCQKSFSRGAVHELRIETRRILGLFDLLKALGLPAPLDRIGRSLKKRLDVFDDLRDTQVQLRLLDPLWREFPEAANLRAFLKRREARLIGKRAHELRATKCARLNRRLKELEKVILTSRRVTAGRVMSALQGMFRQVVALRRQVRADDAAAIHRLRVAFKRFRYASELLRTIHLGFTARRLERMKEYQAAAGDIQDLEVLLARLAQLVKNRKINPAALRRLRAALRQCRRQAIGSFMIRIDELFEFEPRPASRGRGSRRSRAIPEAAEKRTQDRLNPGLAG